MLRGAQSGLRTAWQGATRNFATKGPWSGGFTGKWMETEKAPFDGMDEGLGQSELDTAVRLGILQGHVGYRPDKTTDLRGSVGFTAAEFNKHTDDEEPDFDLGKLFGGKLGVLDFGLAASLLGTQDGDRDRSLNVKKELSLLSLGDEDPPFEASYQSRDARTGVGSGWSVEPSATMIPFGRIKATKFGEKEEYVTEKQRIRELIATNRDASSEAIGRMMVEQSDMPGGDGYDSIGLHENFDSDLVRRPARQQALAERNESGGTAFQELAPDPEPFTLRKAMGWLGAAQQAT